MKILENLTPQAWDEIDPSRGGKKYYFQFGKIWRYAFVSSFAVALIPLLIIASLNYKLSRDAIESEILLRTTRLVSNTRRSISFFLTERRAALDFVSLNEKFERLVAPQRLESLLENLKNGFGGYVDLGVINDQGLQLNYSGPYDLAGKNYSDAVWFKEVAERGIYISDVFMGFRNVPHMVIAVKHDLPGGGFYVLRVTLDTTRFNDLLAGLEVGGEGDAFIINRNGVLQTPAKCCPQVQLEKVDIPVPAYSEKSQVINITQNNINLLVGYAYIPETPFILMIVKHKDRLMKPWNESQFKLIFFLFLSILAILLVLFGGITYLVNQIYWADNRRLMAMHEVEYANKMASLGQLSAGVAHEINNPLAIINEKAGLIKDIFTFREEYANDKKLTGLIDSIVASVERCSGITHRLLNFSRHSDIGIKSVNLNRVIRDVLGFTGKEAEYRSINVVVDIDEDVPEIESDQGKLQEIFLNLITNAFAALSDYGELRITGRLEDEKVVLGFSDNGSGIPQEDLERVFDPFFSTKTASGGTGLGLSITYGLVHELGGLITVESTVGEGTTFTLKFPLKPQISENRKKNIA